MGKKVRVLTKCGEEFFYDHDQEVDTVEIIEVMELPNEVVTNLSSIASALINCVNYSAQVSLIDNQTLKINLGGTMDQGKDVYEVIVREAN